LWAYGLTGETEASLAGVQSGAHAWLGFYDCVFASSLMVQRSWVCRFVMNG
jgi:hypothetical protein